MQPRPIVFAVSNLPPDLIERIAAECEVRPRPPGTARLPRAEVLASLQGADAMIGYAGIRLDDDFFAGTRGLRVISQVSVGFDNLDVGAATRAGVLFCHTPGVLSQGVAELTLMLMLTLARRFPENLAYTRKGDWGRAPPPPMGNDLHGKLLGIVGYGRIGKLVARRATAAFDMRTWYYDLVRAAGPGVVAEYHEKDELLRASDFVSLHVDLNPTSRGLIGARELSLMKPTAYLINTSRGPVVDQPALVRALHDRLIGGAGVDVVDPEPPMADEPLVSLPNAIVLPHIGTATLETRRAMMELAVENLLSALRGEKPPAPVNPEVLGQGSRDR